MKPIRLTAPYYLIVGRGDAYGGGNSIATDAQLRAEAAQEREQERVWHTKAARQLRHWRERFYRDPLADAA